MPLVEIPEVGTVDFPDSMSRDEISSTIKTKILGPRRFAAFRAAPDAQVSESSPVTPAVQSQAPGTLSTPFPATEAQAVEQQQPADAQTIQTGAPAKVPTFGEPGTVKRGASDVMSGLAEWALNNPEDAAMSLTPMAPLIAAKYAPEVGAQFLRDVKDGLKGNHEALTRAILTAALIGGPAALRKGLDYQATKGRPAEPLPSVEKAVSAGGQPLVEPILPRSKAALEKQPVESETQNASSQQETASVDGSVLRNAQTGQGPGVLPIDEGQPGVRPQTQGGLPEETVAPPNALPWEPAGGTEVQPKPEATESPTPAGPVEPAGVSVGPGAASPEDVPPPTGGEDVTGVAQRVREKMAAAGQEELPPRGQGISAPDSVEHGRELLARGEDAESAMKMFEATKRLSSDDMALARAHAEKLAFDARRAEERFGTDSPEWRAAQAARNEWAKRTKTMQTEWSKTGQAQQGEVDIDTGTFSGLAGAYHDLTGKDFTKPQAETAKKRAESGKAADEAAAKAKIDLHNYARNRQRQTDAEQAALDAAQKVIRDNAVKGARTAAKQLEMTMAEHAWQKVREYIDRGLDNPDDIRNKVATDLGVPVKDVTAALGRDKRAKFLMDEAWKKQQVARLIRAQSKRWLTEQAIPGYQRALQKVPRIMFSLKVGFHGTVALGTHAPMVAFQPTFWGAYVRDFGKMYRMVGTPSPKGQAAARAYYEMQVQDLIRRPNYITARRAGLINDPAIYEDYNSPDTSKYFGKLTTMGNRGYTVLKILRQDMFDQMWDRLPKTAQIPEMAAAMADGLNHATGVVKGRAPTGSNFALFAPRLEASRAMWLAGDPFRAADTFLRWNKADSSEKAFALNQLKEKAWVAGTLLSALALNQGFLSAIGSNQKVNVTNPMESDFLKFKVAGMNFAYGSAMVNMAKLPGKLALAIAFRGKLGKVVLEDERVSKVLFDYARSQASPFAGVGVDLATGRDYAGRPLPRKLFGTLPGDSDIPRRLRLHGITQPYSWTEWASEEFTPIPIEEGLKEVWRNSQGMTEAQQSQAMKALITISVMSATGGRLTDDYPHKSPEIR